MIKDLWKRDLLVWLESLILSTESDAFVYTKWFRPCQNLNVWLRECGLRTLSRCFSKPHFNCVTKLSDFGEGISDVLGTTFLWVGFLARWIYCKSSSTLKTQLVGTLVRVRLSIMPMTRNICIWTKLSCSLLESSLLQRKQWNIINNLPKTIMDNLSN